MSSEYYINNRVDLDRATPDALHREFKVSNRFASSAGILATSDSRVSDSIDQGRPRLFAYSSFVRIYGRKVRSGSFVFKGGNDDEI